MAFLGFTIDSSQAVTADANLRKMAAASQVAENAALQLGRAAGVEEASIGRAATAAKLHTAALQAQAAAARMSASTQRQLAFQLNDVVVSLASGMNPAMVLLQQGSQVAQLGLKEVGSAALSMVARFAPVLAVVGAVTAAIGGLTAAINESSEVTVTFGDTALAIWQVVADGVATMLQPAIAAIAPYFDMAWEGVKIAIAGTINLMVRGWMGFLAEIELIAGSIENIFKLTWQDVWNGFVDTVLQPLTDSIMTDLNALRRAFGQEPIEVKLDFIHAEGGSGWGKELLDRFNSRKDQINSTDYASQFFGAVSDRAQQNALTRISADAAGAEKAVSRLADRGFGRLVESVNVFASAARSAFSNMGSGLIDAFTKGGDVALNVLDTIIGRVGQLGENLLNKGLNSLFDIGLNAIFGGLGGGTWNIPTNHVPGGFFPGFANGTPSAPGGMAWVGERGPELINLPRGAQVFDHNRSMQIANQNAPRAANGNGRDELDIKVGVSLDSAGNLVPFIERVARNGVETFSRNELPDRVAQINRNNLRR